MHHLLTKYFLKCKKAIKKELIKIYVRISKPIEITPFQNTEVELHMLAGHSTAHMAIFSLKSFLSHSKTKIPVIIHDDGTLKIVEKKRLVRHINGLRIVKSKIDKKTLKKYPFCEQILGSNQNKVIPFRLFDLPKQSNGKRIIAMDTDVLFFKKPNEIINWINKGGKNLFITDQDSYYGIDYKNLKKHEKFNKLIPRINCGFMCLNQELIDQKKYDIISADLIKVYKKESANKEQTYFADQLIMSVLFSKESNSIRRLDNNYFLYARHVWNNTKIPNNVVCIHFSGPFKMEYYEHAFVMLKDKLKNIIKYLYA